MHGRHNRESSRQIAPAYSLGDPRARELREILSRIYFVPRAIVDLLRRAGLGPGDYPLEGRAHFLWGEILVAAYGREELDPLLEAVESDPEARRWRDRIRELRAPEPLVEAGGLAGVEPSSASEDELILGEQSTLLDVAFLSRGVLKAASVVRLSVAWGHERAHGTGFLIDGDCILTNHHVLFRGGVEANRVEAWFHHELDADGVPVPVDARACDVGTILGEERHDWAVVKLGRVPGPSVGALPLTLPSKPVEVGDRVYIVQHPMGGYKQIGMHRNVVTRVDPDRIQYLTDTNAGSSGSPVFNDRWEIVALHHRYTRLDRAEAGGRSARPGGHPDMGTAKLADYRNQGVRIERVIEGRARSTATA